MLVATGVAAVNGLLTGVVIDLAQHPEVHHAVILDGQLLPIRFSDEGEAYQHLGALVAKRNAERTVPQSEAA